MGKGGDGGGGGRNSYAAVARSSKLGLCLEMTISDLLDLAFLPSGCSGTACIAFCIGNKAFLIYNLVRPYGRKFVTKVSFELQVFSRSEESKVCLWDAYFEVPHRTLYFGMKKVFVGVSSCLRIE